MQTVTEVVAKGNLFCHNHFRLLIEVSPLRDPLVAGWNPA